MTHDLREDSVRAEQAPPLLEIADLAVSFDTSHGRGLGRRVQAVDGVSLSVHDRQTLAVVGESGCGKSVTAMSAMQLIPRPPGRFDRGAIRLQGRDLLTLPEKQMLKVRGKEIAMIFQEPMTSLNPVYTVGDQILEAIFLHQQVDAATARQIALDAMREVGILRPERRFTAYPHEFSGGMRQRIMIAMALACQPRLLLADEPTTALDVTIQAQILDLLSRLQAERGMGVMLITHNLGLVAQHADVVCVMYAGRVVEYGTVFELFDDPLHPYTRGLFRSIPGLRDRRIRLTTVEEVVGDPREFERLPDHARGVVPWWPMMPPPADVAADFGRDEAGRRPVGRRGDVILHEARPGHWVACWRTAALAGAPERRPNLQFRRSASAA